MTKEWLGCAPSNFRAGRPVPYRAEAIVIHIMAGSLRGTDAWFGSSISSVSAHYGIGKDGAIHQYVHEEDTAFHAGIVDNPSWTRIRRSASGAFVNPNFYTIGIEHEGFPGQQWPAAQKDASAALIAEVSVRWSIPLDRQHVITHHEIRRMKSCPGGTAPIDWLIEQASGQHPAPVVTPSHVTAVANLNVRAGAPSTAVAVRRTIPAGAVLPVSGFVTGQMIRSIPFWYRDPAGDFFWAGNTDRPDPAV